MSCINTVYLTDSTNNGTTNSVRKVNLGPNTVDPAPVYTSPTTMGNNANQLGIAADGTDGFHGTTTSIVRYNAASGNVTSVPKPTGVANGTVGAVNPLTGLYYYGAFSGTGTTRTLNLYVYSPGATTAPAGPVTSITVESSPGGNGDIAFDKAGRLYIVNAQNTGSAPFAYNLLVANGTIPESGTGNPTLTSRILTSGTAPVAPNGIVFASDGYLYVGGATTIQRANPITGQNSGAAFNMTGVSSTDLGTCANPSTTKVESTFPDGKVNPTDAVQIVVEGGSYGSATDPTTPNFPGSTAGPGGSAVTEPGLVLPGETYTVRQNPVGSTNLGNYTPTYQCTTTDGTVITQGTGSTATYTVPTGTDGASITCTFFNDIVPPTATPDTAEVAFGTPSVTLPGATNDTAGSVAIVPANTVFTSSSATNGGKRLETAQGVWTIGTDGRITFTPAAGYSGTTPSVDYRITDTNGQTSTSTAAVTVRPGPSATADEEETEQGEAVEIPVLGNDAAGQNPDGSAGTIPAASVLFSATGQPAGSTLSADRRTLTVPGEGEYVIDESTGVVTFTPAPTFFGETTPVRYGFTDSVGNPASSTITVTVTEVTPTAVADSANTPFGTPARIDVTDNDVAGPGGAIDPAETIFTSPDATNGGKRLETEDGVWTIDDDGIVTFTPADGFTGTTTPVGYQATDVNGQTSTSTVTVTVRPGPTAAADEEETTQGVAVEIPVLENDGAGQNADGSQGTVPGDSVRFEEAGQPAGSEVSADGRTLTVPGEGEYVVDEGTGIVTFTPAPTFFGETTPVTYTFTDSLGNPASSTITVTVGEVAPTAVADSANTPFGTPARIDVTDNDIAGPGGALDGAETIFTSPDATNGGKRLETEDGVWTIDDDGIVTFTPADGFTGTTTPVGYRATDVNGQTSTSTVTVTVRPGPTATADEDETTQGVAVTIPVLGNDVPGQNADGTVGTIPGSSVLFETTGQPAGSTLSTDRRTLTVPGEGRYVIDEATGAVIFTPAPTFFGETTPVAYGFTDSLGNPASSTITVTVSEVKPTAVVDSANTPFGTPARIDVTGNDVAGPGGAIDPAETIFTSPDATDGGKRLETEDGVWTIDDDGIVTFTPADGFTGTTTPVGYRATDVNGQTSTSTVTVTVRPGPTAAADDEETTQNVNVTFPVLGNDVPGVNADGTAGEFDLDSFRFAVTDALPAGSEVSANGRTLTVPGEGVYTFDPATGEVTFDPAAQFTGTTTPVTYEVDDQAGNTARATITVDVTPITPVAIGASVKTPGGTPVVLDPLAGDLAGADSAPLDPATVVFTSPDATDGGKTLVTPEGTWTVREDGTIRFEPADGFEGTAGPVEYEVRDTNGTPATGDLNVVVGSGAVASPDGTTTKQGQPVSVSLLGNDAASDLGNPCDPGETDVPVGCDTGELLPGTVVFTEDGQPDGAIVSPDGLTIEVPGEGEYTIDPATGDVTFAPVPSFSGTAQPVAYEVSDSNGATVSSAVTIVVTAVVPVATDDIANTPFDTPVTLDLLENDAEGDAVAPLQPGRTVFPAAGQPAGVEVATGGKTLTIPGQGTYVIDADGNAEFTPAAGFTGTTTAVTYRIEDANGTTRDAQVRVTVRPGPSAIADTDSTRQGIAVDVSPLANDVPSRNADDTAGEWDAASLVFTTAGQPVGAEVSEGGKRLTVPGEGVYDIAGDGTVTFQPSPSFSGVASSVTYEVTDENGNTASSTITILVDAVAPVASNDSASTPFGTPITFDFFANDQPGADDVPLVVGSAVFEESGIPAGVTGEIRGDGKVLEIEGEGVYELNDDGTVTFTPAAGFSGATTPVRYTIQDENGTTTTAAITVTVRPGPIVQDDVDRTPQNVPVTVDVLGNDRAGENADGSAGTLDAASVVFPSDGQTVGTVSDDGKTLTVPGEGVYTIGEDGNITFTPEPTFRGVTTPVVYEVTDSLGNTETATLTITVEGVDPIARDDRETTTPSTPVTLDVLANDSGADGVPLDPTSLQLVDENGDLVDEIVVDGEGTWTVVDGKLVFTPEDGFTGTTTPVTYSIADENGTRTTATAIVVVEAPGDPGAPGTPGDDAGTPGDDAGTPGDPGGDLPASGGEFPWLALGAGLLALLAGLILVGRRRRSFS